MIRTAVRMPAKSSKQKAAEPRVVFVVRVFARPAMSRAIESGMVRETLERCRLEFGGGAGSILAGTIHGPADPYTQERPALG